MPPFWDRELSKQLQVQWITVESFCFPHFRILYLPESHALRLLWLNEIRQLMDIIKRSNFFIWEMAMEWSRVVVLHFDLIYLYFTVCFTFCDFHLLLVLLYPLLLGSVKQNKRKQKAQLCLVLEIIRKNYFFQNHIHKWLNSQPPHSGLICTFCDDNFLRILHEKGMPDKTIRYFWEGSRSSEVE